MCKLPSWFDTIFTEWWICSGWNWLILQLLCEFGKFWLNWLILLGFLNLHPKKISWRNTYFWNMFPTFEYNIVKNYFIWLEFCIITAGVEFDSRENSEDAKVRMPGILTWICIEVESFKLFPQSYLPQSSKQYII